MRPPSLPHILIVGAGPVGLYCALGLAKSGARVGVIDNGARGAGWASGGMLGATYETCGRDDVPRALIDLAFDSAQQWVFMRRHLGLQAVCETIFVARNDGEAQFLSRMALTQPVTPIAIPTGLNAQAAWRCDTDCAIDPRAALVALHSACIDEGVSFLQGDVKSVQPYSIVMVDGTTLKADAIVIATGQGCSSLSASLPELANITPVKGQLMSLARDPGQPFKQVIRAGRLYLVPRGETIVIGATSADGDDDATTIDVIEQDGLYREALELYPALSGLAQVESWAGLRPMTPDGLPMVGWSSLEGVALACGTYRNGWLLAPAIGKHIAGLIIHDDFDAAILQPFSPQRFPI